MADSDANAISDRIHDHHLVYGFIAETQFGKNGNIREPKDSEKTVRFKIENLSDDHVPPKAIFPQQ